MKPITEQTILVTGSTDGIGKLVTANALHPGTYLDTKMVRRSNITPPGQPESGAEAEVFLALSSAMEGVTGKYFNVKTEARAETQAYDLPARKQLRELSLRLTA